MIAAAENAWTGCWPDWGDSNGDGVINAVDIQALEVEPEYIAKLAE
jgi:hypothetical protein